VLILALAGTALGAAKSATIDGKNVDIEREYKLDDAVSVVYRTYLATHGADRVFVVKGAVISHLPNKFFEYSACGKPILSSPIPDLMAIGGPHLSIYRSDAEFAGNVKAAMDNPKTFSPDVERFSWTRRAGEFEAILEGLIRG
jgi:glycosyltransferase involved in cell wall biosynthesis